MHCAYFYEAEDDGFPDYSSLLFVLTGVYLPEEDWTETFDQRRQFRWFRYAWMPSGASRRTTTSTASGISQRENPSE